MAKMTRALLKAMSADIDAALEAVGKKHGVKLDYKGARFGDTYADLKIKASMVGSDGVVETKELSALKQFYPALVNKKVKIKGQEFKVTGYNSRAKKYPFQVSPVAGAGAGYKLTQAMITQFAV